MASLSRTYTEDRTTADRIEARTRTGGPRRETSPGNYWIEPYGTDRTPGSHMPLETGWHWEWTNPLNILPALVGLLTVVAVLALLLS
jgi:hypothetical protein